MSMPRQSPAMNEALKGRTEIAKTMTNFDHLVDDGMDEALKAGRFYGSHAAYNFFGRVWFKDGRFHEQVWIHGAPREQIFSADTLKELMGLVNDEHGWD